VRSLQKFNVRLPSGTKRFHRSNADSIMHQILSEQTGKHRLPSPGVSTNHQKMFTAHF
jgi:hypothetical protein